MTLAALLAEAATAEISLAAIMAGAWGVQRLTGASGWIDAFWTFGVGATGIALALGFGALGDGASWRAGMVAIFAAAWSLRLGLHIVARTIKAEDDPRYRKLMQDWGKAGPRRLLAFLQVQALVGAILALAIGLAGAAPDAGLRGQDAIGTLLFLAALAGEAVADAQIARFKTDPTNRGKICDAGLWGLSRHPNYFFEWLIWVAFAVIALGAQWVGWLALPAPALMYWTLRYASGVPPLEAHMLASRGDAFRAYQARTPVFFRDCGGRRGGDPLRSGHKPARCEIADCRGEAAEREAPGDVDERQLRRPPAHGRLIREVIGCVGEEAEKRAVERRMAERLAPDGRQHREDDEPNREYQIEGDRRRQVDVGR